MKNHWLIHVVALAAILAFLFPGAALAGAGDEQPKIPALLSHVPASSFASGFLSFVDIPVLVAGTPGAVMPESIEGFEGLAGTSAGDAVLRAYMNLSSGSANVYQNLLKGREMLSSSGIDFFHIHQMLETGIPPLRQTWLGGDFDKAPIQDRLQARGYQVLTDTLPDREVWSKGGDIGSGLAINLAQRDIHFPFGGSLGQSWPVILGRDFIGATPDEGAVEAAAYGNEPSLAAPGMIADMIKAAMMTGENQQGTLAQLHLFMSTAVGIELPALSGDTPVPTTGTEPLPAYTFLSLSQVFSNDTEWVLIGLSFPDAATAAAAELVIKERLSNAKLARTGGLLSEQVMKLGGQMNPLFTVPDGSGGHALIIPFRFTVTKEGPDNGVNPFRFFVNLLYSRDLGWLAMGNVAQ
jgi:hypothetical protein